MGRRPKWGRSVNGVLLLNKDRGLTSNTALQQAKRVFFAKRAGHTGSLDPLATGVLPICFGEATKFSQYLLDADKRYVSTYRLGLQTETGDCEGEVVAERSVAHITQELVEACLQGFLGEIEQLPSIYSAIKYQGKPLYQWAREGRESELSAEARQPRKITVYHYGILDFRPVSNERKYPEVDVEVHCSKGTYIRTLAEDLGNKLECGAHVIQLHRTAAGPFNIERAVTLSDLTEERGELSAESLDHHLLETDAPLEALPKVLITKEMGSYFCQGQPVMSLEAYRLAEEGGKVRVCTEGGQFLGVGELKEGSLAPKRIIKEQRV